MHKDANVWLPHMQELCDGSTVNAEYLPGDSVALLTMHKMLKILKALFRYLS